MSLIGALWRGERGLGVTFWVFGAAIYFAADLGLKVLGISGYLRSEAPLEVAVVTLLLIVIAAYLVFISVAIWRSATNYTGHPLFAVLAKLSVVAGLVAFVIGYALA